MMQETHARSYVESLPAENVSIYGILYRIEVGLRELIIEALESKCGPRWWKQRLPGDVLGAFREGRRYEHGVTWSELVPHHPLYYVSFPDLRKVIERRDNWRDVFKPVFANKEVFVGTLKSLEPIRNKIAHNRKATQADLRIAEAAHSELSSAIGHENFRRLVSRCTKADDIAESLRRLRAEAELGLELCSQFEELGELETWNEVRGEWWFDPDYLGHETAAITEYFERLNTYRQLPRVRGSGHIIEDWVKGASLDHRFDAAAREFLAML